jgi:hypothetical protein
LTRIHIRLSKFKEIAQFCKACAIVHPSLKVFHIKFLTVAYPSLELSQHSFRQSLLPTQLHAMEALIMATRDFARALLREVPLAHIEVYIQVLNDGILRERDEKMADNGTICGGGCDAKGGACGAWCAQADNYWGCFDIQGHSGVTREDFQNAVDNPNAFRQALNEELMGVVRSVDNLGENSQSAPHLGPKINPRLWVNRG